MRDTMIFAVKTSLVVLMLCLISSPCAAYELLDTIHSLKEENLHMQYRLGNLTHALQDLKVLLTESFGHGFERQRALKEWSQHGINPETRGILEQALCFSELYGSTVTIYNSLGMYFLLFILHIALAL